MEVQLNEKEVVDVSRLYSIPSYAKKINVSYNAVTQKIGTGKLRSTRVSGILFVIEDK